MGVRRNSVETHDFPAVCCRHRKPRAVTEARELGLPQFADAHPTERRGKIRVARTGVARVADHLDPTRTDTCQRTFASRRRKRRTLFRDSPDRVGCFGRWGRACGHAECAQERTANRGASRAKVTEALIAATHPADSVLSGDVTSNREQPGQTVRVLLAIDVRQRETFLAEQRDLPRPLKPNLVTLQRAARHAPGKFRGTSEKETILVHK